MPLRLLVADCGKKLMIGVIKDGKCVKVFPSIDLPVQVYDGLQIDLKTMVEREQERGKPFNFKLDQYNY